MAQNLTALMRHVKSINAAGSLPHLCDYAAMNDSERKAALIAAIRQWLLDVLALRNWSGKEWANKADVAASTVQRALKEGYQFVTSANTLAQLANAAGVAPPDLRLSTFEVIEIETESDNQRLATSRKINGVVSIPEYDIRLSAGGGAVIDKERIKSHWDVPSAYISQELRKSPESLSMVEVTGDSMFPKLLPSDRILIDHSDTNPTPPGVFALWDGYGLVVKNLQRIHNSEPEKVLLISENPVYPPYEAYLDDVHIIGRVVWFSRRM